MEFFEIKDDCGIRTVTINNAKKKNALNRNAYQALADILNESGAHDSVKCVVISGKGDFFR
jgi:enoyl-CoA hydratase/carnithine racemase